MNVTIKIDDELCKQARHKAVDADMSLSKWVASVVAKEVGAEKRESPTMLDLLGAEDERGFEEFLPDCKADLERPIEFP